MGFVNGIRSPHNQLRTSPDYAPHPTTHQAGYTGKVKIGMDVAAAEFYTAEKMYVHIFHYTHPSAPRTPFGT